MVIDCAGLKMKTARVAPDRGVVLTLARKLGGAIASCLVGGAEDRRRRMGHDAALADMFPGSSDPRVAGRSAQIGGRLETPREHARPSARISRMRSAQTKM